MGPSLRFPRTGEWARGWGAQQGLALLRLIWIWRLWSCAQDGNFWGRRTETLDTYQKVNEQYIQTAVQQHTLPGWWLKWSNPVSVNSCLHSGHSCFLICKKLYADRLSSGLLDKQFLFMDLLGVEMFRYLGMPWKPGGVRGRDFYGRCLCKLNIWLFWRSLPRLCNLHYCFCTFCLFLLILM